MGKIIKEAKNIELATQMAMVELQIFNKDDLKINIIDEGAKGFLGFGSRNAKIEVEKIFKPDIIAINFIREIGIASGLSIDVTCKIAGKNINIDINGEDASSLIGKRGYTLDSLQYLVNLAVNKGENQYINIILDIENYRQRRKESLEKLAINLSKKVNRTKKPVVLEPMSAYERRIIHVTLQNSKTVKTKSDGKEPHRHVIISNI